MSSHSLKIAILDCDTPVPNVHAKLGKFSDIFVTLLKVAAGQANGSPKLELEFPIYDAVIGEVPSKEDLEEIDGVLITGSCK